MVHIMNIMLSSRSQELRSHAKEWLAGKHISKSLPYALLLTICALCTGLGSAHAQTQTDSIITRSVIVQEGETLRTIARREFGKSGLSAMLASFNALNESDPVFPGQVIRIPLFTPVERQFATVISVSYTHLTLPTKA